MGWSMIHKANPTVPAVANMISTWFVMFGKFSKSGEGRTTRVKIMITTNRYCWSAEWINMNDFFLRKSLTGWLAWDSKQSSHTQRCPTRYRIDVHPEWYPGNDHDQNCGQVGLDHVETQGTFQMQFCQETAVISWKIYDVTDGFS